MAIVRHGHGPGKDLLSVGPVAEGVGSARPARGRRERSLECEEMQGFYFSRPVPSIEVENAVAQCVSKLSVKNRPGFLFPDTEVT